MNLLDFFFPKTCLGCGEWGQYVCPDCLNQCHPLEHPICPICTKTSMFGTTHARCRKPYRLDGLLSAFPYQGIIKTAVTKLKYKFITDLHQDLIELAVSTTDLRVIDQHHWLVTPVPLHPRRERWRGFNQSHYLGKALANYTNWSYHPNLIIRTKNTPPQTSLKGQERRENLFGAFSINPKLKTQVKQHPILLIDDVFTTGATLQECAKVLKRNSATKVWAFTLARSIGKHK